LLLAGKSPAEVVASANSAINTALQRYDDENF
jgi:hypothetical protein